MSGRGRGRGKGRSRVGRQQTTNAKVAPNARIKPPQGNTNTYAFKQQIPSPAAIS